MKREMLEEQKFLRRGFRFAAEMQRVCAEKIGVERGGSFHGECAAGKTSVFAQLESFVVRLGARRIENQDAEGVARPAVIAKKALKARLLDAGLLVNGDSRAGGAGSRGFAQARVISLGAAQDGIDERGSGGTKIQRGNSSAVAGLQKRLKSRRREEQLVRAIGVVVEHFHTWSGRAGSEAVSNRLGANKIASGIGAEMRRVDAAENAVPVGVVALGAQEQIARLRQVRSLLFALVTNGGGRSGSNSRGDVQHFFVQQVGLGIFAKKAAPRAAAQECEHFRA